MIRSTYSVDEMAGSGFTQVEFEGSRLAYNSDFSGVYKLINKSGVPTWQRLFPGETVSKLQASVNERKQIRSQRYAEFMAEARR